MSVKNKWCILIKYGGNTYYYLYFKGIHMKSYLFPCISICKTSMKKRYRLFDNPMINKRGWRGSQERNKKFWLDAAELDCASHHFYQLNYFIKEVVPLSLSLSCKIFTSIFSLIYFKSLIETDLEILSFLIDKQFCTTTNTSACV